jgi:glycosyltransferase involved in cell wall biosynthesis
MSIRLSVIIPAYNEEKRIAKTILDVDKYLSKQKYEYEIIVVDDGSKDRTSFVVEKFQDVIKNLRIISNHQNHGKGYVVRQGLLEAKGDFRVFTDADNSTTVDHVEKMWPFINEGYEIIIGSRDVKGAVIAVPQPWYRGALLGNIFNLLVQMICGLWGIWDTQCGFKGLTKKAAEDILPECKIDRWAFDPEILVVAKKKGYKIKEVPVTWINDIESKVKLKATIKMFLDVLKIRWNIICGKYSNEKK